MLDLLYILLTLVCFAGLALLVGQIDRRLGAGDRADDDHADDDRADDGVSDVPRPDRLAGAAR